MDGDSLLKKSEMMRYGVGTRLQMSRFPSVHGGFPVFFALFSAVLKFFRQPMNGGGMMRRFFRKWLPLIGLLVSFHAGAAAQPREQLQGTIDAVMAVLKEKSMPMEEKRRRITELVRERFDFAKMSQQVLAVNWRKATPAQRKRFADLFSRLLESTYIGRIEEYTDEKVVYGGTKFRKDKALVSTKVITSSVEIPIAYKMVRRGEDWKIYDVVVEEVSLVRSYRNSYRDIVKKEGIDGLLAQLEEKLKKR